MSIRKLGLAGGGDASGGVRVAFVPVSVNVTHPLDLAVCAVLAVVWHVVSHLRSVKTGVAGTVLRIPGAVVVPVVEGPPEVSYRQRAWDRLDPWYRQHTRELSEYCSSSSLDLCSEMSVPPPAGAALCDRFVSREAE